MTEPMTGFERHCLAIAPIAVSDDHLILRLPHNTQHRLCFEDNMIVSMKARHEHNHLVLAEDPLTNSARVRISNSSSSSSSSNGGGNSSRPHSRCQHRQLKRNTTSRLFLLAATSTFLAVFCFLQSALLSDFWQVPFDLQQVEREMNFVPPLYEPRLRFVPSWREHQQQRTLQHEQHQVEHINSTVLREGNSTASNETVSISNNATQSEDTNIHQHLHEDDNPAFIPVDPTHSYEVPSLQYKPRSSSNNNNNKTHLVFHVGPPKTATTTLQTDLTQLMPFLQQDDYFYAGRYYNPFVSEATGDLILNRSETPLHTAGKLMLKRRLCKQRPMTACMTDFIQLLQPFHDARKNVLLSDESWGPQAWKTWEDYHALQEALGKDWDVTVIVGYRPLFQWLRSDLFQRYRLDRRQAWKNSWPGSGGGKEIPTLFPTYFRYEQWFGLYGHRFTDFVIDNAVGRVHVRVLHLGQQVAEASSSLRTKFVCDILPDAPVTCAHSQSMDVSAAAAADAAATAAAQTTTKTTATVMNAHHDDEQLLRHCDHLVVRAAALGWIDTDLYGRDDVRMALKNYTLHLQRSSESLPKNDFHLSCPSKQELQEFLELSLRMERKCLGEAWATQVESHTREEFDADVQTGVFCNVNVDATLENEPWKSFFTRFGKQNNVSSAVPI